MSPENRPLLTAGDIDENAATITVSRDTIITPSALDRIASLGIEVVRDDESRSGSPPQTVAPESSVDGPRELTRYIDHTNLSPTATSADIHRLCDEAITLGCAAVCVNPTHASLTAQHCSGSTVMVCGVVGFPTGAHDTHVKMEEAYRLVRDGAREVDMVANHAFLLQEQLAAYAADIRCVRDAIGDGITLKVIIEASELSDEDIVRAALVAEQSGACYVKTSTGVYGHARVEDVDLLRRILQPTTKIKAAGGIRSVEFAKQLITAGADRLGLSQTMTLFGDSASQID